MRLIRTTCATRQVLVAFIPTVGYNAREEFFECVHLS